MEKCRDIMTQNPVGCLPTDTVQGAAKLMKEGDVGSIPVVEDQKKRKLMGIVTDRDLALEIVAEGRDPQKTQVDRVMTREPVTCSADDDLQKALDKMSEKQLRRIPIVDENNQLVGIIAQADVATRINSQGKTGEMVREISKPGAASAQA
jgi:CBS domain-containing protein